MIKGYSAGMNGNYIRCECCWKAVLVSDIVRCPYGEDVNGKIWKYCSWDCHNEHCCED